MKFITLLFLTLCFPAWANTTHSPYSGEQQRDIKALSPMEMKGLLEGKGMGFAKAAELNQYPGPRHVLDLAEPLDLTQEQKSETTYIFNNMREKAVVLGSQLIGYEKELDTMFSTQKISAADLDKLLLAIGETRAKLRGIHLHAHLLTKQILSPHQIMLYDQLRGYSDNHNRHMHKH